MTVRNVRHTSWSVIPTTHLNKEIITVEMQYFFFRFLYAQQALSNFHLNFKALYKNVAVSGSVGTRTKA